MTKYAVTTTESLRTLCIKNNWFTEGSVEQYEKLFYANQMFCSIEEIATIIWLCSNTDLANGGTCRRDILDELKIERIKYRKLVFGVEDENQVLKMYFDDDSICEAPFSHLIENICDPSLNSEGWGIDGVNLITTLDGDCVWERGVE